MNHFRQHYPDYCTGFDVIEFDFDTKEELLTYKVVKAFADSEDLDDGDWVFDHYAMSQDTLMAIYEGGRHWLVIGYIAFPEKLKGIKKWEYADEDED